MGHEIARVTRGGAGWRAGLRAGDTLVRISGEEIVDEIDYQALTAGESLTLSVIGRDGRLREIAVSKDEGEPLGLGFGESMALKPRSCGNRCVFCFIDQMPGGLRDTLYVKDDDWRMSLMMGNYVTLTNVSEKEFERILKRRASPLYISVHTTDPELRCRMMNNRFAGNLVERLQRLKDASLRFHCQIVACPGINDGEALKRTLRDLIALAPATVSIAIVPVGLTKHREGLERLTPFTEETARRLIADVAPLQAECRERFGDTTIYPSDELYCLAHMPVPPDAWYGDYPQIENGVGMLRLLETELDEAAADGDQAPAKEKHILIPTGVSAYDTILRLTEKHAPKGVGVRVCPIVNRFFGESVTVTGLLVGADILDQLPRDALTWADEVLLSCNMLRNEQDRFLDDMTLDDFAARLGKPVRVVGASGQELYDALRA